MTLTEWPIETWIGISIAVTTAGAGLIAAFVTTRTPRKRQVENSFGSKPHLVSLSDDDRRLITGAADMVSDALRLHREAIHDHRDALRDLGASRPGRR